MNGILGQKTDQGQKFLENGKRIPVTYIKVSGSRIIGLKTTERDGYSGAVVSFGTKKSGNKAIMGKIKPLGVEFAPRFIKEVKLADSNSPTLNVGDFVKASEILKPGDMVDATGVSKGKGFQGGVKLHHFKGGPKTHGQSDRHRAPGSIGQGTTPGRVYKGKRMAGRMGDNRVTIKNLEVIEINDDLLLLKGLIPGAKKTLIMLTKRGENKKFVPLFKEEQELADVENNSAAEVIDTASSDEVTNDSAETETPEPVTPEEGQEPASTQDNIPDEAKNVKNEGNDEEGAQNAS